MSVINGMTPKTIQGMKGLFDRSSLQNIPEDHFSVCNNCVFPGNDLVSIREGLDVLDTCPGMGAGIFAISVFPYSILNASIQRTDFLYLSNVGDVIDGATGTILFTGFGSGLGAGFPTDFSCINYGGRVFVSLKYAGSAWYKDDALQSSVHCFDGTNYFPLGGTAPVSGIALTEAAAGIVDAGGHFVSVSYLYRYGYVSRPSYPFAHIVSDGSHNIHIDNIPVSSDPNVIGRVLTITPANEDTFFFVPGGTINNNTATTFDYNFPDTALLDSADYLQDILDVVPNGAALKFYHNRMVVIAPHGKEDIQLFSNQFSPETFDTVRGVVQIPKDFAAMNPNTGIVINDSFYILKPNGTFSTQDNGGDPATWNLTSLDAGLGGFDTSVSNFGNNFTDILDNSIVCTPRGVMMFTGSYHDTPLSFKIDSLWKTINTKLMYLLQIGHDVWNKRVYIACPLYGAPANNYVLMMDYQEGLTPQTVKWSLWNFGRHKVIPKMFQGVYLIADSGAQNISHQLIFAFGDSDKIHTLNKLNDQDEDTENIIQEVDLAPLSFGGIGVFLGVTLNVSLIQTMQIQGYNMDRTKVYTFGQFNNAMSIVLGWVANHPYFAGAYIFTASEHYYVAVNSNVSGTTEPDWLDDGGITPDHGIGWFDTGTDPPELLFRYHGVELYKPFNVMTEKLILRFIAGPLTNGSSFTLNRVDLYGQKMWDMHPQITQNL